VRKQSECTQVGWSFLLWWVLASAVGWVVGLTLATEVGLAMNDLMLPVVNWAVLNKQNFIAGFAWELGGVVIDVLFGAVLGTVIGTLQWLVLRGKISKAAWWVLASAVGWALFGNWGVNSVVGMTVRGAAVGALQWLVLRGKISKAGWWILASAVGFAAVGTWAWAVGWGLGGIITGSTLVWLLRQPRPEQETTEEEDQLSPAVTKV